MSAGLARLRAAWALAWDWVVLLSLVLALATPMRPVQAATNTQKILQATVEAYPSCLQWKPTGICAWLYCYPIPVPPFVKCDVRFSLRVQHYVPDATLSTYHDVNLHPWEDLGKKIGDMSHEVGGSITKMPLHSSGTSTKDAEILQMRDADAIGNPAGMITEILGSGKISDLGSKVKYPNTDELQAFYQSVPSIIQSWSQVPSYFSQSLQNSAKGLADLPSLSQLGSQVGNLANTIKNVQTPFGSVGELGSSGLKVGNGPQSNGNVSIGKIQEAGELAKQGGDAAMQGNNGTAVFCPGAASPFSVHFQSALDAYFWRGLIPLELIYPQSWFPGMAEVGNGFVNTWGGLYPRTMEMHQAHGVKASAVLVSRVLDVIAKKAQPHIYAQLKVEGKGGIQYFEEGVAPMWQRVYPNPANSCGVFGQNDSLWATSYGDGDTTVPEGYVWNVWRRYECCHPNGQVFLGSVGL